MLIPNAGKTSSRKILAGCGGEVAFLSYRCVPMFVMLALMSAIIINNTNHAWFS
jgi:hypothetical protein